MNIFTTGLSMKSEPSGGIKNSTVVCAFIALLLFVVAGLGWHHGWVHEHMCKPVLEKPIHFEEGFSLTSSFSVTYTYGYYVEVVCPRTKSSRSQWRDVVSALSRQLPVKFTITCDGMSVAEGDSPGEKTRVGSAAEDTRIITGFKGETGKTYDLSFHTVGANPALDATKPYVRISCLCWASSNLINMLFSDTTPASVIAVAGLLFAVWPCRILIRKLFRH